MSIQSDPLSGNGTGSSGPGTLTSDIIEADFKGATLNTDKSSDGSRNPVKDDGKSYIGSLPDNSGLGATGVRDINTTEEESQRAAQLGGDPDVADVEPKQ